MLVYGVRNVGGLAFVKLERLNPQHYVLYVFILAKSFQNKYVKYVKYVRTRLNCLYVLYVPLVAKSFQNEYVKYVKYVKLGGLAFPNRD